MNATAIPNACCFSACDASTCSYRRPSFSGKRFLFYGAADLFAGAVLGSTLIVVHTYLVPHRFPVFAVVVLSLTAVMAIQMLLCLALGALIGSMEAMLPGNIAGMIVMVLPWLYPASFAREVVAGAAVSAAIFLLFAVWDASTKDQIWEHRAPPRILPVPLLARRTFNTPSWLYDALEYAGSRRRAPLQKRLFARMGHNVLFAAAGTGLNFRNFAPSRRITAIDINQEKLAVARRRAQMYESELVVKVADLGDLPFPDASFDTVATSSTFCSVPNPPRALQEVYRVLTPGGRLLLFEHVRSRNWLLGAELDVLNRMMRFLGPVMTRDTVALVGHAGFAVDTVRHGYLDVFLCIEAHKPLPGGAEPLRVVPTEDMMPISTTC